MTHLQLFRLFLCTVLVLATVKASDLTLNPRSDVINCLESCNVPYVTDSSSNWTAFATPFNLRLAYQPAVITIPEIEEQVSKSVTCAAAAKLRVQAKGGGHSYASYSSGGQNGSLIIDMENFSEITVDQTTFIAKIGAGQRLGNIAIGLYNQGKRALPHGTCTGVGIGGHALHGGYGYDSREWGLTLDHIVALDVVLANGTQVHATASSYPDVFYAMRGAGESFGIATSIYLQTEEAPQNVLYFISTLTPDGTGSADSKTADALASGFEELQKFSLTSSLLTSNISFGTFIDQTGTGSFILRGWCMDCSASAFNATIFPAMTVGFPDASNTIQDLGWIDALTAIGDPDPLNQPLGSGYQKHDTFYANSLVTREAVPLSNAALTAYFSEVLKYQGRGPFFSIVNLYGGPGSAINIPAADSSAYSDRDSLWVFQNYGNTATGQPPYDPATTKIVDALRDAVEKAQPDGKFTAYLNYIDPDLTPQDAAREYYGAATYDKLLKLKMELDPQFVFWNPQAVGNSPIL